MKRVAKLLSRNNKNLPKTELPEHDSNSIQPQIPIIPISVLVVQVLPYLDRISHNRLCSTCKELYRSGRQQQSIGNLRWPNAKFHVGRPIVAISFSSTGNSLALVVGNSRKISVWNRRRGPCQKLVGHAGIVSNVSFASSGEEVLASCSRTDGTIRLWTISNNEENQFQLYSCLRVLNIRVFALKYVLFSPSCNEIASWGYDGCIRVNAVKDAHFYGSTDWRNKLGLQCFDTLAFSRQRRGLIAHNFNNERVRLWNWETQTSIELFDEDNRIASDYAAFVTSIAFISDPTTSKEYLAVGCRVARVKLWDLNDFTCVRTIHLGSGWSGVAHLVVSYDGYYFACTGEGAKIRVFRVMDGKCVTIHKDHKDRVQSMSISPDGTLASGGCDRVLQFVNLVVAPKLFS